MTLWDWMGLLIVPLTLALAGLWLNHALRINEQKAEAARHAHELQIQELHAQDAAFEAYLDRMGNLLLKRNLSGQTTADVENKLATAYTGALLELASRQYKRSTLWFLYSTALIPKGAEKVDLDKVDLTHASLDHFYLQDAELEAINFDHATMRKAYLIGANLHYSDLRDAHLESARLDHCVLTGTGLQGAHLHYSYLTSASLGSANLTDADLRDSKLINADLRTKLKDAYGQPLPTRLEDADLKDAVLDGAKLHGVDLSQAKHLTQDQVNQADGDSSTRLPSELTRPTAWLE